ncbi:MAG: hypothetical protein IPO24_13550 [Bacteroidetes bacterium]|nr:hypothetical protein [Bacteroidota bacterium]
MWVNETPAPLPIAGKYTLPTRAVLPSGLMEQMKLWFSLLSGGPIFSASA